MRGRPPTGFPLWRARSSLAILTIAGRMHTRRSTLPGGIEVRAPRLVPSVRPSRPSLLLPRTVGIGQAADAARQALCALLTMNPHPRALDEWIAGPYREATRFATRTRPEARPSEDEASIVDAQRRSARVIEAAGRGGEALVRILPAIVHIRPAHDRFGGRGFVPLDVAGASLADKACALALADYFTRPDEFLEHDYANAAGPLRRISSEMCAVAAAPERHKL